jgi:glucokinase
MAKILAADIGGTNSRFALFDTAGGILGMERSLWLKTHEAASFADLLDQVRASGFPLSGAIDAAVLAVAGAVHGGVQCRLPNAPWGVDLREVVLGARTACLINDFAAQAFACRTSAVTGAQVIQAGESEPDAVVGVIGAGTGLGHSALIPDGDRWVALSSEAGHMSFPFTGQEEAVYGEFNRTASGRNWAEGDTVVTGLGLHLLHQHLTGEDLPPAGISARITPESATTRWFARFYGRACRNWAMAVMARGGLFIAGGVAARNPMLVTVPEFLDEFHNSHVHGEFLRTVPIRLNANEESGLYGAALYGAQLLQGRIDP